jgi:UDPglucose 6-dehydrogenase
MTKWAQYLDLDWAKLVTLPRTPVLLDGRHCLDRDRLTNVGYRYLTVGG